VAEAHYRWSRRGSSSDSGQSVNAVEEAQAKSVVEVQEPNTIGANCRYAYEQVAKKVSRRFSSISSLVSSFWTVHPAIALPFASVPTTSQCLVVVCPSEPFGTLVSSFARIVS
jgi:hypothetical protein